MEGVSYEAASMAGNLGLDNLIVLYDANNITADGDTSKTFDDNITDRFTSMNWNVIKVRNSESVSEITSAIEKAKKSNKPTIIEIESVIGKYSKYEGTNRIHSDLDKSDLENIRMILKGTSPFTYSEMIEMVFLNLLRVVLVIIIGIGILSMRCIWLMLLIVRGIRLI